MCVYMCVFVCVCVCVCTTASQRVYSIGVVHKAMGAADTFCTQLVMLNFVVTVTTDRQTAAGK